MSQINVKEFRREDSTLKTAAFLSKNLDHLNAEVEKFYSNYASGIETQNVTLINLANDHLNKANSLVNKAAALLGK